MPARPVAVAARAHPRSPGPRLLALASVSYASAWKWIAPGVPVPSLVASIGRDLGGAGVLRDLSDLFGGFRCDAASADVVLDGDEVGLVVVVVANGGTLQGVREYEGSLPVETGFASKRPP